MTVVGIVMVTVGAAADEVGTMVVGVVMGEVTVGISWGGGGLLFNIFRTL